MKAIIKIEIEYKVFRQIYAIATGNIITDEQITELIGTNPVPINYESEDFEKIKMALAGITMFEKQEEKLPKPTKSKFAQRLEEAQKRQK